MEPGDEVKILPWKGQLSIVAETSINRRYFNTVRDELELHRFADASGDTMCAVPYLRSQLKEYSADLASVIGKCRAVPMIHFSLPRLELQALVMVVRLKVQVVKAHVIKIHSSKFWSESTSLF